MLLGDKAIEELSALLQNSSVLKITEGQYIQGDSPSKSAFKYKMNGVPYILPISDSQISGLNPHCSECPNTLLKNC
jgi:hypothetical protein